MYRQHMLFLLAKIWCNALSVISVGCTIVGVSLCRTSMGSRMRNHNLWSDTVEIAINNG